MKRLLLPLFLFVLITGIASIVSATVMDTVNGVVRDSSTDSALSQVMVKAETSDSILTNATGTFQLLFGTTAAIPIFQSRQQRNTWNPQSGSLEGNTGELSIEVQNVQGRVVARYVTDKLSAGSNFSIENLPQGMYLAAIKTKGYSGVCKIFNLKTGGRIFYSGSSLFNSPVMIMATSKPHYLTFTKSGYMSRSDTVPAGTESAITVKLKASPIFPTMMSIPAGTFQMGDTNLGETPVHRVTLGAFTMSQTLITQAQYQAVMGVNPSWFDSGGAWPVDQVDWYDAALFCNKLSKLAGLDTVYAYTEITYNPTGYDTLTSLAIDYTKNGYRLPTEAEYEYANRAGTTTDYYWGRNYPPTTTVDTLAMDSNAVWYNNSSGTQPVATKRPNAWGLYDMSGNLWEWCNDCYGSYSATSQTNPTGATSGSTRVMRGGAWNYNYYYNYYGPEVLCAAYRYGYVPYAWYNWVGFRVVCGAR